MSNEKKIFKTLAESKPLILDGLSENEQRFREIYNSMYAITAAKLATADVKAPIIGQESTGVDKPVNRSSIFTVLFPEFGYRLFSDAYDKHSTNTEVDLKRKTISRTVSINVNGKTKVNLRDFESERQTSSIQAAFRAVLALTEIVAYCLTDYEKVGMTMAEEEIDMTSDLSGKKATLSADKNHLSKLKVDSKAYRKKMDEIKKQENEIKNLLMEEKVTKRPRDEVSARQLIRDLQILEELDYFLSGKDLSNNATNSNRPARREKAKKYIREAIKYFSDDPFILYQTYKGELYDIIKKLERKEIRTTLK